MAVSRHFVIAALALIGGLGPTACGGRDNEIRPPLEGEAVSLAARPTGGYLWADIDGSVHDDTGTEIGSVVAVTDGQRGLLGLAVDENERVFVSYTDTTLQLVVSEVQADGERPIWRGPTTVQGGNGGRMIFHNGELIVGIGLLNDRTGQADPMSVVGKLVAIDPDATPEEQTPRILSGPWNNPFAFDAAASGEMWVADNDPSDGDERLARGDLGLDPEVALVLPADSAPSGLAVTDDAIYICSYNDLTLIRYDLIDGAPVPGATVAEGCLLDVARLADGDLVYSTGDTIVRITP